MRLWNYHTRCPLKYKYRFKLFLVYCYRGFLPDLILCLGSNNFIILKSIAYEKVDFECDLDFIRVA